MFNDQLSLLAAAIASSGGPGSSDAALAGLVGSGFAGLGARQQQRLRPDPEWQAREAADTLLAAAAEFGRPGGGSQLQQNATSQLQQLLGRPQQLTPKRPQQAQKTALPPHQQQQLDGILAALSGEVADDELEGVAHALLMSYPDLSQQLLQLQSQPARQTLQQQQQLQQRQQQQQLFASLLSEQQQQQPMLGGDGLHQGPSHQELIEQLVRGLMQPDPEADTLEAQLLQQPNQLTALLARHSEAQARLSTQRQLAARQQEQDLLLQLALNPQQQQAQAQQRPQQPGLLQLLQQQHAQQRSLQAMTESLRSGSVLSDVDPEASHGFMGGAGGTRRAAAAAVAAAAVAAAAGAGPGRSTGKGKRKGSAGSGSGDHPLSPISPATAAALAPPPEALAALAASAAARSRLSSSGQQATGQQQQLQQQQQQQHRWQQQQHAGPASSQVQDVYSAAAELNHSRVDFGKPAAALAAAAAAAIMPDLLPESSGFQALGMQQHQQQHMSLSPQLAAQLLQQHGGLAGLVSPAMASSMVRAAHHPGGGRGDEGEGDDGDDGGGGGGSDDDDLVPPPALMALDMPPGSQPPQQVPMVPHTGPLSMRARLGLPPLGLTGPLVTSLPGGPGAPGILLRPTLTHNHHVVFVWDFDDVLVPLHSLITGRFSSQAGAGVEAGKAAALGRQLQGLVLLLADTALHFKELEDVDTVHVGDVWHLAAQYEQRRNRRRQQQQQEQQAQDGMPNGRALTPPVRTASPEQQPAAKRARLDQPQQQQQQPLLGVVSGNHARGTHNAAHKRASDPGHLLQQQQQQAKDAKSARAMSEQPSGLSWAPLATPPPADVTDGADQGRHSGDACRAAAAELVLRPYKLGPPPDELQQRWDDIAKVYDAGSGVLPLPKSSLRAAEQLYEVLDATSSGWLRACRTLLEGLSGWQDLLVTHVVVGRSQLVPLLAKLLLTRLDTHFGLTQVYSAAAVPKVAAFKRVRAKFGPRARYVVLGGGFEEEAAADLLSWPFVRVVLGYAGTPGTSAGGDRAGPAAGKGAGSGAGAVGRQQAPAAAAANGRSTEAGEGKGLGNGSSGGSSGGSSDGSGGEDEEGKDEGAGAKEAGAAVPAAERSSSPTGGGPVVALDALGSRGHTLLDLTADKLKSLVLSMH